MAADRPIVFGPEPGVFGMLRVPDDAQRLNLGVVVCAPFGHPNVCAYRPLRTLGLRLAERGLPVLRFDWPGTGDSGDPEDAAPRLELWIDTLRAAVAELRERAGVDEVALVGLRVGATLALVAAEADPSLSKVVLLGPYVSGRVYLREQKAFQALAEGMFGEPEVTPPPLPEGAIESSGFLVSRDEVDAFESIDFAQRDLAAHAGRHLLIVTAQSDRGIEKLGDRLLSAGADVTRIASPDLLYAWEGTGTSVLTPAVSSLVGDWLASAGSRPARPQVSPPGVRTVTGPGYRERQFVLDTPRGRLVGILCEPLGEQKRADWLVFLNAGRVRRSGPNRIVTSQARNWARRGLPSLRLDLGGIGDSDGDLTDDEQHLEYSTIWYEQSRFAADVRDAVAQLAAEHDAERFALVGLCSGAFWGYQVAPEDERVAGVVLVNTRLLYPDHRAPRLKAWKQARKLARNPRAIPELRSNGLRELPRLALEGAGLALIGKGNEAWQRERIVDELTALQRRGTRIAMVFSEGDLGFEYFERHLGDGSRGKLERLGVALTVVRGPDHTFRPLWSQPLLERAIERELVAIGFLDGAVAGGA